MTLAVVGQRSSGYQRLPGSGELNAPSLFTQTIDKNWEEPPFPHLDLTCPAHGPPGRVQSTAHIRAVTGASRGGSKSPAWHHGGPTLCPSSVSPLTFAPRPVPMHPDSDSRRRGSVPQAHHAPLGRSLSTSTRPTPTLSEHPDLLLLLRRSVASLGRGDRAGQSPGGRDAG